MTKRRRLMLALAGAAVLVIVGRTVAGMYADYLWYDSLGAVALWRARLGAVTWLRVGSAAGAGLFAFANFFAVRQSVVSLVFPRRLGNLEIGEEVPGRYLIGAVVALSVIFAVLLALPQDDWTTFTLARSCQPFRENDPYIERDLGFFVCWLPFENALWTWAFLSMIAVMIAVLLLYALTPSLKWQRGSLHASTYVRRHFTVLVGVLLLMLAWSFRLDMYGLLVDGSGADGAFGYVDYQVGIPGDLVLALVTLAAALVVVWSGYVGQLRLATVSVLTVIALSLLIRELAPAVVGHLGTEQERTDRERPFIRVRAAYTRRAYGVGAVPRADARIAYPSLAASLPWVPVWEPPALVRAIDGARAGSADSVRVSWRVSPAGLLGDVVDPPPPSASSRAPWTLARIVAAGADERGGPLRVAGPSASAIDDTPLDGPVVYPGAPPYVIIADSLSHSTGTSLESIVSRIAMAWSLQNFRILSTDFAQPHPTIVTHRDVRDRLDLIAPFFAQGRQVEPLVVGDSLYWAVDLYSASQSYPLSRRVRLAGDNQTYLHHAAVAIVQAATGEISVVPDSILDPIARTWSNRLPSVFGTWSGLPSGLRALLAPPIDASYAQALAFGRYGTLSDTGRMRHVPFDGGDTTLAADDLPLVLPGARSTVFALPLVDDSDRLGGLLIAAGGGEAGDGGVVPRTMWYPLAAPGPRWTAILDRLKSMDSAGSATRDGPLSHGRVRTVPVMSPNGPTIGFVQPTYHWRPQSVPALNRVALLVGDTARSVVPANLLTAEEAGAARGEHPTELPLPGADFNVTVNALYSAMRGALRRGDWAAFGRAFDALGRALGRSAAR